MSVGGLYKHNLRGYDYWSVKESGEYFFSGGHKPLINKCGTDFTEEDVEVCTRMGPNVLADWGKEDD